MAAVGVLLDRGAEKLRWALGLGVDMAAVGVWLDLGAHR
jgi:hypothetical protein